MARGILFFKLPEENSDFKRAVKSLDLWLAISEMEDYLRGLYKHDDRAAVPIEEIRENFYRILNENNVNLEEL